MKNREIAEIFRRMAMLLEMQDENVFKIRSYNKAADSLENLSEDIAFLKEEDRLSQIPGVGKALRGKIAEYLETGRVSAYEDALQHIPETIFDIMEIPSVGPKKARLFYDRLKITDINGLKKAAHDGRLAKLPHIRKKTVENILNGIRIVKDSRQRMDLGRARQVAQEFLRPLSRLKEVKKISVAGSLRRCKETVRDIDILVDSTHPKKVMDVFVGLPWVKKVNLQGETKSSVLTQEAVQVDLRVVPPRSFGAALLYFTGSKSFNVRLRQIFKKKKIRINEYGIFDIGGRKEKFLAGRTEKECLKILGLPDIPPELREDIGEERIFKKDGVNKGLKIPRLLETKDIRGDLHVLSLIHI